VVSLLEMKTKPLLNDYHRKESARLVKEISEQPPVSREQAIKNTAMLARNSRRAGRNGRKSTGR